MNFFIAILNDSFIEAREILEAEPTEDTQLSDFIEEYAKKMLKEISEEIQGLVDRKDENTADSPNRDRARNKETWERDYFLYWCLLARHQFVLNLRILSVKIVYLGFLFFFFLIGLLYQLIRSKTEAKEKHGLSRKIFFCPFCRLKGFASNSRIVWLCALIQFSLARIIRIINILIRIIRILE